LERGPSPWHPRKRRIRLSCTFAKSWYDASVYRRKFKETEDKPATQLLKQGLLTLGQVNVASRHRVRVQAPLLRLVFQEVSRCQCREKAAAFQCPSTCIHHAKLFRTHEDKYTLSQCVHGCGAEKIEVSTSTWKHIDLLAVEYADDMTVDKIALEIDMFPSSMRTSPRPKVTWSFDLVQDASSGPKSDDLAGNRRFYRCSGDRDDYMYAITMGIHCSTYRLCRNSSRRGLDG
jgi:hypothetical protein